MLTMIMERLIKSIMKVIGKKKEVQQDVHLDKKTVPFLEKREAPFFSLVV